MAKFFTESRLLQQDVKLLIEGVSNQLVLATVVHPVSNLYHLMRCSIVSVPPLSPTMTLAIKLSFVQMGNIAERLLHEGFARCVDWSMAMVSNDRDKLRAAEK